MEEEEYNPKNIDKAVWRMEQADELSNISRESTNIFSVFDDVEADNTNRYFDATFMKSNDGDLYKAEIKRNKYLQKVEVLKKLIKKYGTKDELVRITSIGVIIETTDFNNISSTNKQTLKENMIWCNKKYEEYLDS